MELIGLPDFHAPLRDDAPSGWGCAYWPFGGGTHCFLVPDALQLAIRADGTPDFELDILRPLAPGLPPAPRGLVDMSLKAVCGGIVAALAALRRLRPDATVEPAAPACGFLRFVPAASDAPAALLEPIPIAPNGLGSLRHIRELSLEAALLLREELAQGTSTVTALAELEIIGVAPRLPIRVRFDPAALLAELGAQHGRRVVVRRDDLVARFRANRDRPLLEIVGVAAALATECTVAEFAEAMTDLVRLRYGAAAPSSGPCEGPALSLIGLEDTASEGNTEWDLAQPVPVCRPVMLRLDAFAALGAAARRSGLETLVSETTIPPIGLGSVTVDAAANLPPRRVGLRIVGADLIAAPRPPSRPDAVIKTAVFIPPEDKVRITLQLSPSETPTLAAHPFVWREGQSGPIRLDGTPREFPGGILTLGVDDFPVVFIPIEASDDLLSLARVHARCRWDGSADPLEIELTVAAASAALALPLDVNNATLEFEAIPLQQPAQSIRLAPKPARPTHLSLASFPEFGAHSVVITVALPPDVPVAALDFRPEALPDEPASVTTLAFTKTQASREWMWFAASPFAAGYRWRHHVDGSVPGSWSDVQSPFQPLEVQAPHRGGPKS
jgi:hypothetical protein